MRPFFPDDDAHAGGPTGQVEQAGELGDPRAVAHLSAAILKVPSARTGYDSRQALSSQVKGTFHVNDAARAFKPEKAEVRLRSPSRTLRPVQL
jgi:hypothetical protein